MKEDVIRAYKTNILKVHALVYIVVAIPIAYYGLRFINLIKDHKFISVPLFCLVVFLSVMGAFLVQHFNNPLINLFLNDKKSSIKDFQKMKLDTYYYAPRMILMMLFGWIILLNLIVFIPLYLIYSGSLFDMIVINLLTFSCALLSTPITFFISENTSSKFMSLPEVIEIPEPENVIRFSLGIKVFLVCMVIITSLILNTIAAMLLSIHYNLSQNEMIINLSIISFFGVVATIIISRLFANSIKTPCENIRKCTVFVKDGNLSETIPRLANDELGDTSEAFNAFLDGLKNIIQEIKNSVQGTSNNGFELQKSMKTTDNSVIDINSLSGEVQSSVLKQSETISEVTATIEQIVRTIDNQNKRINDQATSVVESSSAIEQMISNIKSIAGYLQHSSNEFKGLQKAMNNGSGNIEDLKQNVILLSSQSDQVYEANSIINNIASQTNLLAMNAAIEAAHAGESGKGFAVVADEIRKLAEESNLQSKVISDSLGGLKTTIEQAVIITGDTGASFEVIKNSVQTVNELEQQIKQAIEEQSSGSSQILQALSSMNDITVEVHTGSNEMLVGSEATLTEIERLLKMTENVKDSTENVVEKAKVVKQNTDQSLSLLDLNQDNMETIQNLVSYFKTKN